MSHVYLPVNLTSRANIDETLGYLRKLQNEGLETGLMCLIIGGQKALIGENKKLQHENFKKIKKNLPVIVMTSFMPLTDLDFYHLPNQSIKHIKLAVDFVSDLKSKDPIVTFHLNTLMTEVEWQQAGLKPADKLKYWNNQFEKIVWPALKTANDYAEEQGVELKVETTPVPESGDLPDTTLNTLGNPFPLYSGRGIPEVRNSGLGIVLDLCHTYTLYKAAKIIQKDNSKYDVYKGLFPSDINKLIDKNLMQEVEALAGGDIVHLNDSRGIFDSSIESLHEEGIAPGAGEIENLSQIIKTLIDKKIKLVFEIHDANYTKGSRPNLEKSIQYLLKFI